MNIRTIDEATITPGTRVLVRVDFDVAIEHGKIREDYRIRASLGTIDHLLRKQARIRIIAHLGRPEGKRVKGLSLEPIAAYAAKILKKPVSFVTDPFSYNVDSDDHIVCFENLRFWKGEEKNDPEFAKKLEIGSTRLNSSH